MTGGPRRLTSLTSARFFAASGVVAFHSVQYLGAAGPFWGWAKFGFLGVPFFFILSGFVLTYSRQAALPARRFYRNRFARVWPLHALTAAVAFPLLVIEQTQHGVVSGVSNLLLVQAWVPAPNVYFGFNAVSWTLSCEAFFYALFPLIAVRVARLTLGQMGTLLAAGYGLLVVMTAAVHIAVGGQAALWILYVLPPSRLFEFVLGVALATAMRRGWRPRVGRVTAAFLLAASVATLAVASRLGLPDPTVHYYIADVAVLPAMALLVSGIAAADIDGRPSLLRREWLVRLGEASFALYLLHHLVLRLVNDAHVPHRHGSAVGLSIAAVFVICVALSVVVHRRVERPLERLLRSGSGREVRVSDVTASPGEPSAVA